ncbi:TIGR04222 domain-containing membrane protein [Nonomuraea jiangxiensis]|nr:TIGR04222 domain-containing membrane protein [Nonomuraea jiangxiensis]
MDDGVFYTAAIALFAFIAFTAIRTHLTLASARRGEGTPPPLDVYEAAYLAGGPRRVINTALVSLVAQGGVRISREGIVTPVQGYRPDKRVPVERAVYRHVKAGVGRRTTAKVRHSASGDDAMRLLSTPLWQRGLLLAPADRVRSRRRTSLLVVLAALAAVVALVSPFLRGPLGAIVIAAAAAVAGAACFFWARRRLAIPLTKAGRAALAQAGTAPAIGSWRASEEVGLVALHGLTKLPDRRLADTLRRDTRARTRGGSVASCCAPGRCGSYGGGSVYVLDGGSTDSGSGGGFFDLGGLFDFGGSHGSHGSYGGGDFGGGGGGSSCGGGGGGSGCGGGGGGGCGGGGS